MENILTQAKNQLRNDGYTYIDLVDSNFIENKKLKSIQKHCLKYWYRYFTDKGISEDYLKIDFTKKLNENQYFKQPKDSPIFKALYGHVKTNGDFYINTRKPAVSQNDGMGLATSQPCIYKDKKLIKIKEKLRPIFNHLYGSNTHLHLSRFGLKLPFKGSKDMVTHTDMSYIKDFRENQPKRRNINDPVSYAPYSDDGTDQRIQALLCLSDSDSGWYGYKKSHLKYKEIGDKLNWPGKTKSLQLIPKSVLNELNLERVDVKSKFGRLIMWNCGVAHGNSKCQNTTPRLVMYINYQSNNENTSANEIIGLGNQPTIK
jgi:hypothetical protein|tara:strand:- start:772 stop:1719 length:948 start_codon:yes stop_codon:yes gene_type:complete